MLLSIFEGKDMKTNKWYCTGKYDPISLNGILFDQRAPFVKQIPPHIKEHGIWYYIGRIIYAIIKETGKIIQRFPFRQYIWGWRRYGELFKGNIVFVVPTVNNYRALEQVIKNVSSQRNNVVVLDQKRYNNAFPRILILQKSVQNIGLVLNRIRSMSPSDRRIAGYYMAKLMMTTGFTYYASKLLNEYKPESVIFANDHDYDKKTLVLLCEDLGIKTIYAQHASVSLAFPELHFSYSFLDGTDAYEKYTAEGKKTNGKVVLLGALRFDKLSHYRVKRRLDQRNCIGIAVNVLDERNAIEKLCDQLRDKFTDKTIKIRTHPAMKNKPVKFSNLTRILYTCSADENLIDYLDSIDCQIAGDTGVHMDAILGGVPTIAYNFTNSEFGDNYKYVEKGLVKLGGNVNDVIDYVSDCKYDLDPQIIRPYDASYGKSYAGCCSEIVADLMSSKCDFDYVAEKNKFIVVSACSGDYYVKEN